MAESDDESLADNKKKRDYRATRGMMKKKKKLRAVLMVRGDG